MLVRPGNLNYHLQKFSVNRFIAIIFTLTVVSLFCIMHSSMSTHIPVSSPPRDFHFEYEVLKGYFKQSEDETDDVSFDFIEEEFGLIERDYDVDFDGEEDEKELSRWRRFENHVRTLDKKSNDGESVKVLFLGRHGQGWHNVAETKYGTEAWDCYWSMLDGADGMTWSDANLTEVGQRQAKDVHGLWKKLLPKGLPPPETHYVSPMTRTIETADLSFKGLELPGGKAYKPLIKELSREALGVHTCDRRSPASHLLSTFPHITLEPGFSEPDPLWEPDYREPRSARKYRLSQFLDDVFANDEGVFLSLTSHSGAIGSILEAVKHRTFALQTGGVIPVLVRAKRVEGERKRPPKEPSEGPPACKEPPTTLLNY
ncbi:phosphoglycerate mutase-like protein [Lentithecium fluviatile CBS 122367]|uniref:Phosphoglycerate mutase-like protein n=1 Tax=Lentithecium fluviatile CBS 122367 TaxID=1168545 RepID=A0A6G1IXN4_9PLEO|nr:phosphoglycerate mutase-like protein [Lentithecium fluviatile CBS 122367]